MERVPPEDDRIIIVTGSNGRIGDAVMRRFAGRFGMVIGTERGAPEPPPGCVYVPIDVTSDDSVREGLTAIREHHGTRVASFVHLAAYYDFLGAPSPKYEEITVGGTGRLPGGLRELGFGVEQFIFSSTMLVHRPASPGQFIAEDWPLGPTWAYPKSKVHTERLIGAERGSIPAVHLRIAGVYDDGCHSIPISQQIQRIYERQLTSRVYSAPTSHGQSFLHMDDVVEAIALTVERRADLPPVLPVLLGEPEALATTSCSTRWRASSTARNGRRWVIVAPWLLGGATPASTWSGAITGALVILLSLPRGAVGERYGSWERFITWPDRRVSA